MEIIKHDKNEKTMLIVDLPRFDAAPSSHLRGLSFEGQGAFPTQG